MGYKDINPLISESDHVFQGLNSSQVTLKKIKFKKREQTLQNSQKISISDLLSCLVQKKKKKWSKLPSLL